MNCRGVGKALSADLGAGARPEIQAHLRRCGACRSLYRDLRAMRRLTSLLEEGDGAPEGFSARLRQGVSPASLLSSFLVPLLGSSLALLLGLSLFWIWPRPADTLPVVLTQPGQEERGIKAERRGVVSGAARTRNPVAPEVEIVVGGTARPAQTLRIPSEIWIRSRSLHDDLYLNHASY